MVPDAIRVKELAMSKIREFIQSPHIQIALVLGFCIILMAYVSKRVLPEPIGNLPLAVPPFIVAIYEGVLGRYKGKKICTTWYWIVAVLVATILVILFHAI